MAPRPPIQAVIEEQAELDTKRRSWRMVFFNPDGTPASTSGATGAKGDPGDSAYDIWVAQPGNAGGTVNDYLASLVGPAGDAGADGAEPEYGTLANRPSAATAGDRALYFAIDEEGGTLSQVQSGAWKVVAQRGLVLGYAEITSDYPTLGLANTDYDIPGLNITVPVGDRPILLECYIPTIRHAVASKGISMRLFEGSTIKQVSNMFGNPAAGAAAGAMNPKVELSPSVGDHTYKATLRTADAGIVTASAALIAPAFLRAVEC